MDLCEQAAEAVLAATDPTAGRNAVRALLSSPDPPDSSGPAPWRQDAILRTNRGGGVSDGDSRGEAGDGERSRDRNR